MLEEVLPKSHKVLPPTFTFIVVTARPPAEAIEESPSSVLANLRTHPEVPLRDQPLPLSAVATRTV